MSLIVKLLMVLNSVKIKSGSVIDFKTVEILTTGVMSFLVFQQNFPDGYDKALWI